MYRRSASTAWSVAKPVLLVYPHLHPWFAPGRTSPRARRMHGRPGGKPLPVRRHTIDATVEVSLDDSVVVASHGFGPQEARHYRRPNLAVVVVRPVEADDHVLL